MGALGARLSTELWSGPSVELDILRDWADLDLQRRSPLMTPLKQRNSGTNATSGYAVLVGEYLSQIKKITMSRRAYAPFDDITIINWIADEPKKSNEAWSPPQPSFKAGAPLRQFYMQWYSTTPQHSRGTPG